MKFIPIALFIIIPFIAPGQNDSFPPVKMPVLGDIPKDTAPEKLRVMAFDPLTGTESYLESGTGIRTSLTESYNPQSSKIIDLQEKDTGFTRKTFFWLKPADSLSFFPDYPVSTTVLLNMQMVNKATNDTTWASCSGMIVDKRLVLTAGHCVAKNPYTRAIFIGVNAAYNRGGQHYGFTKMVKWYALEPWLQKESNQHDIALIEVDRDIGLETGWIGMGTKPDSFFLNKKNIFTSFGYPAVKFSGERLEGDRIYYYNGHFDFAVGNCVCVNQTVYFGQSGSGFFYNNYDLRNMYTAYGVISYMAGDFFQPYYTCFRTLTPDIMAAFKSIMLSTEELNKGIKIGIYPNPASGKITIDIPDIEGRCEYILYDITGKMSGTAEVNTGNSDELDVSGLQNGLYLLKIITPVGTAQTKFIKE